MDAARGRHARRQESHVSVAAVCVTIVADLVGSGALENVIRVVRVAELALIQPCLICVCVGTRGTPTTPQSTVSHHAGMKSDCPACYAPILQCFGVVCVPFDAFFTNSFLEIVHTSARVANAPRTQSSSIDMYNNDVGKNLCCKKAL